MKIVEYWIQAGTRRQRRVGMLGWDADGNAIGGYGISDVLVLLIKKGRAWNHVVWRTE